MGPYSSQEEANAAASAAQSEAVSRLQGEAQAAVDAAIASARSQLANITFTVRETRFPTALTPIPAAPAASSRSLCPRMEVPM